MTWSTVGLAVLVVLSCVILAWTFVASRRRGQQKVPRASAIAAVTAFVGTAALGSTSPDAGIGARLWWILVFLLALGVGAVIGRRSTSPQ